MIACWVFLMAGRVQFENSWHRCGKEGRRQPPGLLWLPTLVPRTCAAAATKWKCFQNYKNSALAGRRKNMFWPIRGGEGCLINMIEGDPCQCWSAIKLQDYKTFSGLNNGGGTEAQRKNLRKINLSTKTQFRAFRLLSFNWTTDTFLFAFFAPVL